MPAGNVLPERTIERNCSLHGFIDKTSETRLMISKIKTMHALPPLTNRGVTRATFTTSRQSSASLKIKPTLVLDWLQCSAKLTLVKDKQNAPDYEASVKGAFLFETEILQGGRNKNFNRIYQIYTIYTGQRELFATLECMPHVSFIPAETAIIKVDNKFLYCEQLEYLFKAMLSELRITFKYWNRIDVAADFERLHYRNLTPQNFISLVARDVYRLKGGKRGKVIKDEDVTIQKQTAAYKGISWGSRNSGLKITMYNKSAEMRQKKHKPYIVQTWNENGLGLTNADVWRLEFSFKKDHVAAFDVDKETGEFSKVLKYSEIDMIKPENWQAFYKTKYEQHFQVAVKGKEKQFCRMKKIKPFEIDSSYVLAKVCDKQTSDKMVRHRIKHTVKLIDRYANDQTLVSAHLHYVVCDIVNDYALEKWFKDNFPNISLEQSSVPQVNTKEQQTFQYNTLKLKQNELFYEYYAQHEKSNGKRLSELLRGE